MRKPKLTLQEEIIERLKRGESVHRVYHAGIVRWTYRIGKKQISAQDFRQIRSLLPLIETHKTSVESRFVLDTSDHSVKQNRCKRRIV